MLSKSRLPAIKLLTPLVHPSAQTLVVVSAAECRWFAIFSKVEPKLSPPLLFLRLGWKAAKGSCFDSDRMLVGPSSPFSFFPSDREQLKMLFWLEGSQTWAQTRCPAPHTQLFQQCNAEMIKHVMVLLVRWSDEFLPQVSLHLSYTPWVKHIC